ncbi:putative Thioredoxin-like domain-containing protein [Seiridium cardinale]|uniref:Protein disulfide-isomerase n=1 Tax=Seiridium cardinale TaxID=138064 RepID=A0ABR2XHZ7_9PEZI
MRPASVNAAYLLASAALAAGWNHLDEPDFVRAVGGHSVALIAFESHSLHELTMCAVVEPSTAASQALEPEWEAISKTEKSLGSVDCTALPQLCRDYDVISYPTIRYFDGHGTITPYRGPRIETSIVSFLRRAARPTVTRLDEKKITAFQSIDDAVIVAHINARDTHIQALFKSLAHRYDDRASFGLLEIDEKSTLVCYNNKDDEQLMTSELTAIDALSSFVEACIKPLVGEFSRRSEVKYFHSGKSLVYYLANTRKERDEYVDVVRPLAKKYREFISFVTVDAIEYGAMTSVLGLRGDSFPALAIENPGRGQIFPFTNQDIVPDAIEQFILDIAGGKVQPWSSLPIPDPVGPTHDEL